MKGSLPGTRTIIWGLVFGFLAAAMYQADILGIRSKVLGKVFDTV